MAKLKSLRSFGVALAALLVASAVSIAAGLFPGFPIVGQASYCGGFSTGTSGQVCTVTVPAGPTQLTGNELVPADTGLAQGQSPQTVLIPIAQLGALPYAYNVATNAVVYTISALTGKLIIDPATVLTTTSLVMPAATGLADGQTIEISTSKTLSAVVMTAGSGTSVSNPATAMIVTGAGAYGVKFIYRLANTTWYRLQ